MVNIKGGTRLTGLLGYPVEHTKSPAMHNAGFAALGLDYCYVPLEVRPADLGKALAGLKAQNFKGVNVTVPHKEKVIEFLDEVRGPARFIGAVNTIINEKGRLIGYNTDGPGFVKFLKSSAGFNPQGKTMVIFGAGGAARALSFMLLKNGAGKIFLFDIDREKNLALIKALSADFPGKTSQLPLPENREFSRILSRADLLVNATPLGMKPLLNKSPLEPNHFKSVKKSARVVDLIYNPAETVFLKAARRRKFKTYNGLGLLVWQGILAFELFTGRKIKPAVFFKALAESGRSD